VWATAAALAAMLSLVFILLAVVMVNGLGVFWPSTVVEVTLANGGKVLGERIRSQVNPDTGEWSTQFKTGNRELDPQRQDFRWIKDSDIRETATPPELVVLERLEHGNFYGYRKRADGPNATMFATATGQERSIATADIVHSYNPNAMGLMAKCGHYLVKIGELLWDNPREANTEGGLFPAIFGTVMLIFLMAATCFPLGVLAGIYLGEYAKEGLLVRIVRIAVNNLAGIPSIVYGIFGLGFFVYGIGGQIDRWFFPAEAAAGTPTFGTGGILWASLTLGLLTVPVVIVSTEEALRSIPRGIREGSLALGATKFQTLVRVLVPMASPGSQK
jgi:phosphate transport system permease protein